MLPKRLTKVLLSLMIFAGQAQALEPVEFEPTFTSTTTYDFRAVGTIDVCVDLGYFIDVDSTNDIEVYQDTVHGSDPFMTYYGCGQIDVFTTFPAIIKGAATATSVAGGHWSVTLNSQTDLAIAKGTTPVVICVLGTDVQTQLLITAQAQDNVPVAEITIQVAPQ
ncbi:MAG: hypothetical protein K9N55_18710 [Phycisphaerae bacterium]|nr:hypothetical protein [Phycisphaerae bacterium]